jgi:hypothetical protein
VIRKNNAVKLVFDAGVKYFTEWNHFSFGMAIRNFASNIRREQQDEQLPLTFTMGGTISLTDFFNPALAETHNINLAVDFLHSNSYSERINIGAEYLYMKLISLRAGYQTNRDIASWSAGMGVITTLSDYDVEVSYSFSKMNTFDGVSRISMNIGF